MCGLPATVSAPNRPSSVGPLMSERSDFGAAHAISGNRMNANGDSSRDFIELMTFCWRCARVRSSSCLLQSLWRVRASASACLPLMCDVPARRRSVKPPFLKPPLMRDTTQPPL